MSKRFNAGSVNWSFIIETLLPQDLAKATPLRIAYDKCMRDISSKPAELPKIDWSFYKNKISTPAVVDSFQKGYESLSVPYPSDQGLMSKTESRNSELLKSADKNHAELMDAIAKLKEELTKAESVMKYSEMTVEEFYLARPDLKIDNDKPKFWPHLIGEAELKDKPEAGKH